MNQAPSVGCRRPRGGSRMPRRAGVLLVGCALAAVLASAAPSPAPRVVAVGDAHGDARALSSILSRVGLIDAQRRWAGGSAVLVVTGDYLDRGPDVPEVVELLMSLEDQAKRAGGRAIIIMGNHEAMNAMGDLRYVAPEAFASFAGAKSEERRAKAWRQYERLAKNRREALNRTSEALPVPKVYQPPSEAEWLAAHPPGLLEYREAFASHGRYGRWIRRQPVLMRVGDTIFVHGGLHPDLMVKRLDDLTARIHRELEAFDGMREWMLREGIALPFFNFDELLEAGRSELSRVRAKAEGDPMVLTRHPLAPLEDIGGWLTVSPNGPLWFRGFALWTEEEGPTMVDRLQQQYGPIRFVVGHTQAESRRITPRFAGRVFLIDTAMSSVYEDGRPSALDIDAGEYTAVTLEDRAVLVSASTGPKPASTRPN